jgi:hypothetical protein
VEQSVVIPCGGDILRLEWTLAGLMRQAGTPIFEIIVVGDTVARQLPGLRALVERFGESLPVRLVPLSVKEDESLFRAGTARNLGIYHAVGEQVVFVDEDCVPDADLLAAHWEYRDKAVIGLRRDLPLRLVQTFPGRIDDGFFGMYATFDYRFGREQAYPGDWISCNASAPREVLLAIGGFDETFSGQWGTEDIQLGCRMRDYGVSFVIRKDQGWVTHLGHPRRQPRADNNECIGRAIRGEYSIVANGGMLSLE